MTLVLSTAQIDRYRARLQGQRLLPILRGWQIRRAIRRLASDGGPAALAALKESADSGLLTQERYRKLLEVVLILNVAQPQAERIRALLKASSNQGAAPPPEPLQPDPADGFVRQPRPESLDAGRQPTEPETSGESSAVANESSLQWWQTDPAPASASSSEPISGSITGELRPADVERDETAEPLRSSEEHQDADTPADADSEPDPLGITAGAATEWCGGESDTAETDNSWQDSQVSRSDVEAAEASEHPQRQSDAIDSSAEESTEAATQATADATGQVRLEAIEGSRSAVADDPAAQVESASDVGPGILPPHEQTDAVISSVEEDEGAKSEPTDQSRAGVSAEVNGDQVADAGEDLAGGEGEDEAGLPVSPALPPETADPTDASKAETTVAKAEEREDSSEATKPARQSGSTAEVASGEEAEDSDLFDTWSGPDQREERWDPQDDPDYPWISTLDRYVRLDPDERMRVIAKIARSDLTIEDWIEKLLHQPDYSLPTPEHSVDDQWLVAILEQSPFPEGSKQNNASITPEQAVAGGTLDGKIEQPSPATAQQKSPELAAELAGLCSSASASTSGKTAESHEGQRQVGTPVLDLNQGEHASEAVDMAASLASCKAVSDSLLDSLAAEASESTEDTASSSMAGLLSRLLLDDWNPDDAESSSVSLVDCATQLLSDGEQPQPRRHATLLAGLLTFHLREKEAQEKDYVAHLAMNEEALEQDSACIAVARLVSSEVFRRNKHQAIYRFDTRQPFRLSVREGNSERLVCQESRLKLEIHEVLETDGLIKLTLDSREAGALLPQANLIHRPKDIAAALRGYLADQASAWIKHEAALPAAVSHLLSREGSDRFRRLAQQVRDTPAQTARLISEALFEADGISLVLQGPPGTGKTTCAAEVITDLVDAGWNIGVCANSHLAINHLLVRTADVARSRQHSISLAKFQSRPSKGDREVLEASGIKLIDNASFSTKHDVYGATAYGFSHSRFEGLLDLLVIDEASQVSLANMLAMGRCARNLLLVGDQQQLAQPTVAEHPGESGLSCLSYATAGQAVIEDHKGVFLSRSWRLPPNLCGFVSEQFYERRLEAEAGNASNRVDWSGQASGLQFVAVDHSDNHVFSLEEVQAIDQLVAELLGSSYLRQSAAGLIRATLDWNDIAIMAPFNAQVNLLQRQLGPEAQVGTVDRFQGREAPVSIYSVTSSRTLSTRGLEFVLDANRVNVAISRAQCLAIVVASPSVADLLQSSGTLQREALLFHRLRSHSHATPAQP